MLGVPCDVACPIVGERGVRGDGKLLPSPPLWHLGLFHKLSLNVRVGSRVKVNVGVRVPGSEMAYPISHLHSPPCHIPHVASVIPIGYVHV